MAKSSRSQEPSDTEHKPKYSIMKIITDTAEIEIANNKAMARDLPSTYAAKHSVIMAHLAAITEHMNDIPEPESADLTWADVDDLTRIENDLAEIVAAAGYNANY